MVKAITIDFIHFKCLISINAHIPEGRVLGFKKALLQGLHCSTFYIDLRSAKNLQLRAMEIIFLHLSFYN